MSFGRLFFVFIFLQSFACSRIDNSYELLILNCGAIEPVDSDLVWVQPKLADEFDPKQVQAIGLIQTVPSALKISPLGCFGVGQEIDTVLLRHPLASIAARLERSMWQNRNLVSAELKSESPLGFSKETLNFQCNQSTGRNLHYNFSVVAQASSHQHFYTSQAKVFYRDEPVPKSFGHLDLNGEDPYRLNFPLLIKDGPYRLELLTQDIFELEINGVKAKPLSCDWSLDTRYPLIHGFKESLKLVSAETPHTLEVKPGQTLTLAVEDDPYSLVNICLAPIDAQACEDFLPLKNSFYAPTSGAWKVFYFTQDLAGNRSPVSILANLAVINRDLIQSIQSRLAVAGLQSERANAMAANWNLLRAFRDYYSLPLDVERSFLNKIIATTFTDVAHHNSLQLETRDHSFAVKKYQQFKPDRVTLSLDSAGNLMVRRFDGPLLDSMAHVADFSIRNGQDLAILFKNGSIQLGLQGLVQALPFELGEAQWLVPHPTSKAWAVSGTKALGVLQDLESVSQLLWSQTLDQSTMMLGFDPMGQRLALIAKDRSFHIFNASSGLKESHKQLNSLCNYRQGILTPRGLFIAAYEAHEVQTDEFYRCELLVWTGDLAPLPLSLPEITEPSSIAEYDPHNYRLDDVVQLSYSPTKNWLAISRNLPDRSCYIFDLNKNQGRIFYQPLGENKSGKISALHLDEDGQYFAMAIHDASEDDTQSYLDVWQLGSVALEELSEKLPTLSLNKLHGSIQKMAIIAEKNWIATVDDTRTARAYNLIEHESFQFESKLRAPLTQGVEFDLLAAVQNEAIVLFDRFAAPLERWASGERRPVLVKSLGNSQVLVVSEKGELLVGEPAQKNLKLVNQSVVSTVESAFLSPKQQTLILTGLDRDAKPTSELLIKKDGGWLREARFDWKLKGATWSLNEALFAVGTFQGESFLFNQEGKILLKIQAEKINGFPSKLDQRFSQDGSRWVAQVDSHLEVYDTRSLMKLGQNLEIPILARRFGFAGNAIDEFLLAVPAENNRSTAVRLTKQGSLEFLANFDSMIEVISQKDSIVAIFAQNLYLLDADYPMIVPEFQNDLGFLSGLFGENEALVVAGQKEFLYELAFRKEDTRMLLKICEWMGAMLLKDENSETVEWRNYCREFKARA